MPVTLVAVTGKNITQRAITNVSEIEFLVPTLRVVYSEEEGQGTQFALRGLRSTGSGDLFREVPAIGEVVGRELYDLGSVQVLKGRRGRCSARIRRQVLSCSNPRARRTKPAAFCN